MPLQALAPRLWRVDARLRNARFRARLPSEQQGPVVVLSPHPDDAVLSCWSVLVSASDVRVANVFTGSPAPGSLGPWDELVRAADSTSLMEQRIDEDRRALALAGRSPVNLGFLDNQHRGRARPPSNAELDAALRAAVA